MGVLQGELPMECLVSCTVTFKPTPSIAKKSKKQLMLKLKKMLN